MIVDINHYLVNKSYIQKWYADHGNNNACLTVSIFACSTHCPCIVMAFFLAESIGFVPELVKQINGAIKFYGYTQINHQPPNSPFSEYDHATT